MLKFDVYCSSPVQLGNLGMVMFFDSNNSLGFRKTCATIANAEV
jgi:hypothetical protein